jgi:hypothetical protein
VVAPDASPSLTRSTPGTLLPSGLPRGSCTPRSSPGRGRERGPCNSARSWTLITPRA